MAAGFVIGMNLVLRIEDALVPARSAYTQARTGDLMLLGPLTRVSILQHRHIAMRMRRIKNDRMR